MNLLKEQVEGRRKLKDDCTAIGQEANPLTTNSATVTAALRRLCESSEKAWNRKITFQERIVQAKAEHSPKVQRAILTVMKAQLVLDGEMREVGHVGGPDPHEEPPLEEYCHERLPKAGEVYVKEPVIDANSSGSIVTRASTTCRGWLCGRSSLLAKRHRYPTFLCFRQCRHGRIKDPLFSFGDTQACKERKPVESQIHRHREAEQCVFVTLLEGDESPAFWDRIPARPFTRRRTYACWYTEMISWY